MLTHSHSKLQPVAPPMDRVLQRKCACGTHRPGGGSCAACADTKTGSSRLTIGSADDPLEGEADRVAERVLAMRTPSDFSRVPLRIQRLTRGPASGGQQAPASVDRVLASPGRALDPPLRRDMETRFGHDFSGVRVHEDAAAAQSAREVGASAYTVGSRIVFGPGGFAPGTSQGRRLLAHELAHVVQQGAARGPAPVLRRSLALDSTMQICRRSLTSRTIKVDKGGLKVVLDVDPVDTSVIDCRDHPFRVTLTGVKDWWFDPDHATCEGRTGRSNLVEFGAVAKGEYYLTIERDFDHPYCCLEGAVRAYDVRLAQNSAGCQAGKSLSVMDVVHGALDIAGFIPVLGAIPDGVNAVIYVAEGDWVSAGISAGAAVPFIGDGAKLAAMGGKAVIKVSEEAALTLGKQGLGKALKEAKVAGKEAAQTAQVAGKEAASAGEGLVAKEVASTGRQAEKAGAATGEHTAKKGAKEATEKEIKEKIAKCEALYRAYDNLPDCHRCNKGDTPAQIAAKISCFYALIAGRAAYLKARCDYVLPGSVRIGSRKKEKDHGEILANLYAGLRRCEDALHPKRQ